VNMNTLLARNRYALRRLRERLAGRVFRLRSPDVSWRASARPGSQKT